MPDYDPMPFAPPDEALQVQPILELRERFERRTDRDFNDTTDDSTSDLLTRFRAGFSFRRGPIQGQVVYQYSHDENWNAKQNLATWRSDLLLGFVGTKVGAGNLTLGRQRISVGDDRLLGVGDWNNISNAWDGGRFVTRSVDLFAARLALYRTPDETASVYGGTFDSRAGQTLVVYKHDERAAIDEATVSQLYRNRIGPVSLDAEAAGQVGHRDSRRKLAGAIDAIATVPVVRKVTFSIQGSVASGGGDRGTTNTFDQLYPSSHDRHGLADLAGWRNLRDLGVWFRYAPDARTGVKLQYHRLALDSSRDAWYDSSGAAYRRSGGTFVDPTGSKGRDLGDEIDVDLSRSLNAHQTVRAGVGLFRPGRFVRAFEGGSTADQVFGYVQWAFRL